MLTPITIRHISRFCASCDYLYFGFRPAAELFLASEIETTMVSKSRFLRYTLCLYLLRFRTYHKMNTAPNYTISTPFSLPFSKIDCKASFSSLWSVNVDR